MAESFLLALVSSSETDGDPRRQVNMGQHPLHIFHHPAKVPPGNLPADIDHQAEIVVFDIG